MGHQTLYHSSWDIVFDYLNEPSNFEKYTRYYVAVEPLIKQRLHHLGVFDDVSGHTLSIFADLFKKEQKRYRERKLQKNACTAKITTYYYPVIKALCIDYINLLKWKLPLSQDFSPLETMAQPGIFDGIWGSYQSIVLEEMHLYVHSWIAQSDFEASKKCYLNQRFLQHLKFPEILKGKGKVEFDTHRKWIQRQGNRLAKEIAVEVFPAIIDCYKLPISRKIDPLLIKKYLLGSRTKLVV